MKQVIVAVRISAMALLLLGAVACGDKKESADTKGAEPAAAETAPAAVAPAEPAEVVADAEAAKAVFEARCAACHGTSGKGDGPGAAAINPKPRDYTDSEWQASVADEDIATAIVKGGMGVGKSAVMPSNPDLKDKPAVVKGLVDIIRGFEK